VEVEARTEIGVALAVTAAMAVVERAMEALVVTVAAVVLGRAKEAGMVGMVPLEGAVAEVVSVVVRTEAIMEDGSTSSILCGAPRHQRPR
jgi:uncharacterized membrane protein (GlpM family)